MHVRSAFFVLLLICFTGCASTHIVETAPVELTKARVPADAVRRAQVIGTWYGEAPTTEGGVIEWISTRDADSSFEIRFRIKKPDGTIERSTEVGFWGVAERIYFTMTRGWMTDRGSFLPADPEDETLYDAYEIQSVSEQSFEYRNFSTGNQYKTRRVDPSFDFPAEL